MRSWTSPAWTAERARAEVGRDANADDADDVDGARRRFRALHRASVADQPSFWSHVASTVGYPNPSVILDHDASRPGGSERWFPRLAMNAALACFEGPGKADEDVAIRWRGELDDDAAGETRTRSITRGELRARADAVANALSMRGWGEDARVAIILPFTAECVAIYLGVVLAGAAAVCVADSFSSEEIKTRLEIGRADVVITMDVVARAGSALPLYAKVASAAGRDVPVVVLASAAASFADAFSDEFESAELRAPALRANDETYCDFLRVAYAQGMVTGMEFQPVVMPSSKPTAVLFSSGTTGAPKAIPWDHSAPLHGVSDGRLHMDIKHGDVVSWPTNLGWMMGSWLIYQLANGACLGVYEGAPTTRGFCDFVSDANVTHLGLVPSIVSSWRKSGAFDANRHDWSAHLRAFALTGEASSPTDVLWLASRVRGYVAPVLEYCGGTELASGYALSAVVLPNAPSCFSSASLGGSFALLNDEGEETNDEEDVNVIGEVAVRTPFIGSSTSLLNGDNRTTYYDGMPRSVVNGAPLRRHGDRFERLRGGFYRAHGRTDDTFNLGGIKTSSVEIERACDRAAAAANAGAETAAVAVPPIGGGPDRLWIVLVPLFEGEEEKTKDAAREEALVKLFNDAIKRALNPLFKVHRVLLEPGGLPRNASNKILRRTLRAKCADVQARDAKTTPRAKL